MEIQKRHIVVFSETCDAIMSYSRVSCLKKQRLGTVFCHKEASVDRLSMVRAEDARFGKVAKGLARLVSMKRGVS